MIDKKYLISPNSSIKESLKKMNKAVSKCLIVTDNKMNLLGTLSDGDIRNAFLKGKTIKNKIDSIYFNNPVFLNKGSIKSELINKFFKKNNIFIVPIIDTNRKVVDAITIKDFFHNRDNIDKKNKFSLDLVIMAGGKGQRMQPFTNILPKPLIPIKGKPVIERIIENFNDVKIKNIFLSINYKSNILKAFFSQNKLKNKITYIEEKKPMGTCSSIRKLIGKIKKPFFVSNCDIIVNANYEDIYKYHTVNKNDLTIIVSTKEYKIPYGVCKIDNKSELVTIDEKPKFDFLVNIGLYILNPENIKLIPLKKKYDFTDLITDMKKNNKKIGVYPIHEESWFDVGQWNEFRKVSKVL